MKFGPPQRVSPGKGNDINHRVSPGAKGGLWVLWQADRGGQFDILVRRVGPKQAPGAVEAIAATPWNEWRPSVASGAAGKVYAAWDAYDGRSYNVMYRRRVDGKWGPAAAAASGPAFQGRPQVAAGRDGQAWVLWERRAENWGKPHRGMPHRNPRLSDSYGPLHRFRRLHVGLIDRRGVVHRLADPLPMPGFAPAPQAADAPGKLGKLTNPARGKSVTTSFAGEITAGRPKVVTDGKLGAHLGHGVKGIAWAQVDLGEVKRLGNIRVWHYYRDGRAYLGNRLAVSATGKFAGEEKVIFDSATDGTYRETKDGRLFSFKPVEARYIRNWLSDNTSNRSTQWVEIEAYAPLPPGAK